MYKVLITTVAITTSGAFVHTTVVGFDTREAADAAISAVRNAPNSTLSGGIDGITRSALPLYVPGRSY